MITTFLVLIASICSVSGELEVKYILTTPEGNDVAFDNKNVSKVNFDKTREYKVVCHGWMADGDWYANLTSEYMKKGNVNVINAYYTEAMTDPFYINAVSIVPTIGAKIAELICNLNETKHIPIKQFHLIGHSLGAQIVGVAGEYIKDAIGIRVARITGLDPAFPGFYMPYSEYKEENRLGKGDADFVDVIHTGILSVPKPMGDVDFYPNGGWQQKGCRSSTIRLICNHQMAIILFILSISERQFLGRKCQNFEMFKMGHCDNAETLLLGSHTDKSGAYYFDVDVTEEYQSVFPDNLNYLLE